MNKNIKLIFSLVIVMTAFVLCNTISLSADESKDHSSKFFYDSFGMLNIPVDVDNNTRQVDACPGVGRHHMRSSGFGKLIKVKPNGTNEVVFSGRCAWQCSRCKEVVVTQFDPIYDDYVGYYCFRGWGSFLPPAGCVVWATPEQIHYKNGSTLPYCDFYYSGY